jgi:hypothetical protein
MTLADRIRAEARLIILKALAGQPNESLTSTMLALELETFSIRRERGWVHDEMRWLAEAGAIRVTEAGTVLIGTLTEKGARHLSREIAIEGVLRPSREA